LNRFSWFRSDKATLDRLIKSQTSRFVLLSDLKPLIDDSQEQSQLYYGTWSEVENLVGDPYGQKEDLTDVDTPALVFLGIDESDGIAENGIAYWALDVTPVGPRKVQFEQLHQSKFRRRYAHTILMP
jgi:NAD+ diphosphatase